MREAVGLFRDAESLRAAADALMLHGFDRGDLSILPSARAVVERLDGTRTIAELEDDPKVPTAAYVAGDSFIELKAAIVGVPFFIGAVAAGGAIVGNHGTLYDAGLAALVAGGLSGLLGLLVVWFLSRRHDAYLRAQLARGGLLLWVHTNDPPHEERACSILKENGAADVHVHDLPETQWDRRPRRGKVVYGLLEFLAGVRPPAAE
jgi:hypothetical protein